MTNLNRDLKTDLFNSKCKVCLNFYVCLMRNQSMPCYGLKKYERREMVTDTNPINTNDKTRIKKAHEYPGCTCSHLGYDPNCPWAGHNMATEKPISKTDGNCQWYEIEDNCWQTECGHYSPLFHTTWNFCPYCGTLIKQVTSLINTDN